MNDIPLILAKRLSEQVNEAFACGEMLEQVTPVTASLLRYWFCEPYTTERTINFHAGQRQAILNIIYLHEVLGVSRVSEIYNRVGQDLALQMDMSVLDADKYAFPKYAVKMATGTGKTWVMHALLIWQILNARHEATPSGRYTKRFLIVAPGLVVYDRLLDAFKGRIVVKDSYPSQNASAKDRNPSPLQRNFDKSDFVQYQQLLLPPEYRDEVFSFIQTNTVSKEDGIGRKVTGEGLIALTNWHLFMSGDNLEVSSEGSLSFAGNEGEAQEYFTPEAPDIISDLLPTRPGIAAGNALDTLDRQYLRGNELNYLQELPDLMVINDEAHHIHENRRDGATEEVEWQRGLNYIASGKERFFQIDFSATPYDMRGNGRNARKQYFPHIVVDFDLTTAMRKGLVKTLLLDRRQQLTNLETLDYKAERNERGKVVGLSEGQRLMLRAGLEKLRILEDGFRKIDPKKCPKMLVMCEDTSVVPFVEQFLTEDEGLEKEDVLPIDSNKKGEVEEKEWQQIKERLFNIDQYEQPRVIISVLMLREGFDVNNICVVVPLRSSESSILLEQTVGRGLRLMWREVEYQEEKEENRRAVLQLREAPRSYLDMLSIVEHPKFMQFYEQLLADGLAAAETGDGANEGTITGDIIRVPLREGYEQYDMFWLTIRRDAVEEFAPIEIDIESLEPFSLFSLEQLRAALVTHGETFISEAALTETRFGKYQVTGDLFNATCYQEYLQKMLRIITMRLNRVGGKQIPMLQIGEVELVQTMDWYIRTRLFGRAFDPFQDDNWKILLSQNAIVTKHIVKQMSVAINSIHENVMQEEAEVVQHWFSEVDVLRMRESYSVEVQKCIYERQGYPAAGGGLEKAFIDFLDRDSEVEAFLKISESQHAFAVLFYIRTDGLLASYHPDFMVRTEDKVYIIETKGDNMVDDGNVRQKQLASLEWCKRINALPTDQRMNREWEYLLLPEENFYPYAQNGATLSDLARLLQVSKAQVQGTLF